MSEKLSYLSEIQLALKELGGEARLGEINDFIERRGQLPYLKTNPNWKAAVRRAIQAACPETKSYSGGKILFYSVYGLGEGYWGLRDYEKADGDTPIERRICDEIRDDDSLSSTEKEMIIKARIGQGLFREEIIEKYGKCIITGIENKRLLVASHVKPWRSANNHERLSPENGLLLSPLFDKLFDIGLISFTKNMHIMVSQALSPADQKKLFLDPMTQYIHNPSTELRQNMEYHRDLIFQK